MLNARVKYMCTRRYTLVIPYQLCVAWLYVTFRMSHCAYPGKNVTKLEASYRNLFTAISLLLSLCLSFSASILFHYVDPLSFVSSYFLSWFLRAWVLEYSLSRLVTLWIISEYFLMTRCDDLALGILLTFFLLYFLLPHKGSFVELRNFASSLIVKFDK